MRLCCAPRAGPAVVRARLSRCGNQPLPSIAARLCFPLVAARRLATQASPSPRPSNERTPPPQKPPASAPSLSKDVPEAEEEQELEYPAQQPDQVWLMQEPLKDDPTRWHTYDLQLPARRFDSRTPPFDVLANDHRRILYLAHLLRYEPDMRTKEVLLWRLHKELIFHDILEKRVLYPIYKSVLHKTDPKNTATARLKKEHSKMRRELRKLKSFKNPQDPLLANAVNAAIHRMKIHFYEEETKMFPMLDLQLPNGVQAWMRYQMIMWAFIIRVLGPFAARSRRPPWNKFLNRMWSLWHWRWGR